MLLKNEIAVVYSAAGGDMTLEEMVNVAIFMASDSIRTRRWTGVP